MSERPASRGEYDNTVESVQSDVDHALEALQDDIDLANLTIADYIKHDQGKLKTEYLTGVINHLNENWDYIGHSFMVSGRAYLPKFEVSPEAESGLNLRVNLIKGEAYSSYISAGFATVNQPNDEGTIDIKIAMMFCDAQTTINSMSSIVEVVPKVYAEPHEVNLSYIRQDTTEVVSSDLEECIATIDELSKSFLEQVGDDESEFYAMSLEEQQGFFKSYIDGIDAKLPDPQAEDYLAMKDAESPLFYIAGSDDEGKVGLFAVESGREGSETARINGAILGFCVPDEITNRGQTRYGSRSELTASSSGLCAMVKPFKGSNLFLPEELQTEDMIVPLNDLGDVSYSLI